MDTKFKVFAYLLLSVSILTIIIVFWIEYIEKILPCELCTYQRWPYFILVLLSILMILIKDMKKLFYAFCFASLILFISALLAIYHSGIEQSLWSGFSTCSSLTKINTNSLAELKKLILETPIIRCDVISWKIYIFSLSNINSILSLSLFIICLLLNIDLYKNRKKLFDNYLT